MKNPGLFNFNETLDGVQNINNNSLPNNNNVSMDIFIPFGAAGICYLCICFLYCFAMAIVIKRTSNRNNGTNNDSVSVNNHNNEPNHTRTSGAYV